MLVFFIHGVATKNADYSKQLQNLLREEFLKRDCPLPHFYAGFWGNVLKQTGQIWNWIHQDLQNLKKSYPQVNPKDIFRYQEFREDFISEFFGDVLTYFHTAKGLDIRDSIADQLYKFLKHHPVDQELHLVTHSLGTVILWDVLFSDRFESDDPAYTIRSLILSNSESDNSQPLLKSITTMGSPILFFNMMIDVQPSKIRDFVEQFHVNPLRWLNILHSSDIIAYPLESAIRATNTPNLFFRDKYIWADANPAERTARTLGQGQAAMAIAVADAHCSYWNSEGTTRLIASNIIGDCDAIDSPKLDLA